MDENQVEVLRPGDPGYDEAVANDLVGIFPDNRPISLQECLQYVENAIETLERSKAQYDVLLGGDADAQITPAQESLARFKKLKMEFERDIAQAEAKEPGSSQPPEPTEEEKEFYAEAAKISGEDESE